MNFYKQEELQRMLEDDIIDELEEGFMQGYLSG